MKILVTGGAGYLGSVLTPFLLAEGLEVTVLDSFLFPQNSLLDCCGHGRFRVLRGDVRDERVLKEAMAGRDFIIPLAALVGLLFATWTRPGRFPSIRPRWKPSPA